jgi:hypothetical protein
MGAARGQWDQSAVTVRAAGRATIDGPRFVVGFDRVGARLGAFDGVVGGLHRVDEFGGGGNGTKELLRSHQTRVDVAGCEQAIVTDLEELMR